MGVIRFIRNNRVIVLTRYSRGFANMNAQCAAGESMNKPVITSVITF
jgi:hypothetical protein